MQQHNSVRYYQMNVTRAYPTEPIVYFRVRPCGYTRPRRGWNRTDPYAPPARAYRYALPNWSHHPLQPQAAAALHWMCSCLSLRAVTFVAWATCNSK